MKRLVINARTILERTRWRNFRYCEVEQFYITYGDKVLFSDLSAEEMKRIKIPFAVKLDTRKKDDLEAFIKTLGRSDSDKQLKALLTKLLGEL